MLLSLLLFSDVCNYGNRPARCSGGVSLNHQSASGDPAERAVRANNAILTFIKIFGLGHFTEIVHHMLIIRMKRGEILVGVTAYCSNPSRKIKPK
jgi:hypothetical protein